MSHPEQTPPPPPLSEAPPSYYSNESLPSPDTGHHHHLPSFHNPQFELEPDSDEASLDRNSGNYNQSDERGEGEDPPPPYSPGLGAILSTRRHSQHDVNDAPPSYYSLFGQIREAREQSSNNFTFLRRVGQIILNTVGCTILLIVFMSVPFTILVIGSISVHDCPLERFIPIYLIVGGISGIIKNIALIVENIVQRYSDRLSARIEHSKYLVYIWRAFNLIFNLFMLAWTIAGGYWVYHVYYYVTSTQYQECNELLYKFGFGIVTSSYILLLLTCVCACCCIGICLKVNKRRNGLDDSSSQSDGDNVHESGSENDNESQTIGAQGEGEERYLSERDSLYSENEFRTTTLTSTVHTLEGSNGESFLRRFRYLEASEPINTRVYDRAPQRVSDDDTVEYDNPPYDGAPQRLNSDDILQYDNPPYDGAPQRPNDNAILQYDDPPYDGAPQRPNDNAILQYDSSPYPTRHYSLHRREFDNCDNHCADHTPHQSPDLIPNHVHRRPHSMEVQYLGSRSCDPNQPVTSRDSPLVERTLVGSVRGRNKTHSLYITTSSEGYSVTEV